MFFNKQYSSPNYSKYNNASQKSREIKYIILHYTEMSLTGALNRLCDQKAQVSAHYLIAANGEIFNLVDDSCIAWHAGVSAWHNDVNLNQYSIGIEIDNNGKDFFPTDQMDACKELCHFLMNKYNINSKNIICHSDIAPSRKLDPGILFDWNYLFQHNIGLYHQDINNLNKKQYNKIIFSKKNHEQLQVKKDDISSLQNKLHKIGYDINITGLFDKQTNDVIRAFQSHFYPQKIIIDANKHDKNLINLALLNNFMEYDPQIIHNAINYYTRENIEYSWDDISEKILNILIKKYYLIS